MGLSFLEGLSKSTAMILVSEIGDKTFFVAALMAMRHSRRLVLVGALGALWVMTILSAAFGWAAPSLISRTWTHHGATLLFFCFGLLSLKDGIFHKGGESEELKEVEAQLGETTSKKGSQANGHAGLDDDDLKTKKAKRQAGLANFISPVLIQTFSLTFLGEWGDRSQIATIGLAAEENVFGVTLGGMIGHAVCTGAAVLGGKHLATRISERSVAICGGLLFLIFGLHSFLTGADH
eukprot:TRINITY_DN17703_c0_g2_i1.p1 TRINITY_DN17703_c0_g2~~TRINITY_DN17703_c0_g2_i1.p1  ORF type:complete len:236 (-),score=46.24 TRINITY_DN17703_c0_g2_i1:834-1541(-)